MVIKITGAVIVCAACSLIGFYCSLKGGYRVADLLEMKKAVIILKSEIEFAANPLPQALRNIAERTEAETGRFFGALADKLGAKEGLDIFAVWQAALREHQGNSCLTRQDIESLEQLGRTLGYMDKNLQLASIDLAVRCIDEKVAALNAENIKNKKLYRSIGAIAGIIVTIVLY